jgi:fluoride exporter
MADKARKESALDSMETLKAYAWVGLGSACGGMARYWFSGAVADWIGQRFPWGTIVINITGSFIIGVFSALTLPEGRLNTSRILVSQLVMYGLCGGYTTFSSFSLHTLTLARDGQWLLAAGNIVISVAACLLAVWLGFLLGEFFNA